MPNEMTKGVKPFSRDRLKLVSRDRCAKTAMAVLHKIQQDPTEEQVAAVAMLFAVWCIRLGQDPHDLYLQGVKMVKPEQFHRKGNIQLETLRDFAGIRLAGDDRVSSH